MGQQKGNPTPSYQNQAYEALRPNTNARQNRDMGTKPVMIDDTLSLNDVVDVTFATDSILTSVSSSIDSYIATKANSSTLTAVSSSINTTINTLSSSIVSTTSSIWIPTISNKTGVFVADATINSAYYTKIGNIVQATFNISWTTAGGPSIPGGFNFTLPVLPNNNFSNTTSIAGTGNWYNEPYDGAARVGSGNGSKLGYYSVSTLNANGSETFINVQYTIDN